MFYGLKCEIRHSPLKLILVMTVALILFACFGFRLTELPAALIEK